MVVSTKGSIVNSEEQEPLPVQAQADERAQGSSTEAQEDRVHSVRIRYLGGIRPDGFAHVRLDRCVKITIDRTGQVVEVKQISGVHWYVSLAEKA